MAKIVFFGTPEYVLPILAKLHKYHEVVGVVTQPPKTSGRNKFLTYSPVDSFAHKRKIPIIFEFDDVPEADLGVCASYGRIIPAKVISLFKNGILNIHPSLLPKYRGASPVPHAIKDGLKETGVSIIKMDEKMDHGPIVAQFKEEIKDTDAAESLRDRLFERSADVFIQLIPAYMQNKIKLVSQDDREATFTKTFKKEDGFIEYAKLGDESEAVNTHNFIRAMNPWPGAWTEVVIQDAKKRLKLIKSHVEDGRLVMDEVQLEGKNPVSFKQFSEGYKEIK